MYQAVRGTVFKLFWVFASLVILHRLREYYSITLFHPVLHLKSFADPSPDVHDWLLKETDFQNGLATLRLLANIHPQGTKAGVVIASPSNQLNQTSTNYFYHWIRE